MSFLLDTNFVSEWTKPRPNARVVAWLASVDEDRTFLSVVTIAELRTGVERLARGKRRESLDGWLRDDVPARFGSRILPVDLAIAERWGRIVARCAERGRPIAAMDALIAATASVHGLAIVTRNVTHFAAAAPESVIDPSCG